MLNWKKINKNRKLKIISIVSICIGIIQISSILFTKFFILICFPEEYQNDNFILAICGLLVMGGILILLKKNSFKHLYRLFALGLIADIFAKIFIFGNSYLIDIDMLIIKIPIIIGEIGLVYYAFKIANNKYFEFNEDFSSNPTGVLDDKKYWKTENE